MSRTLDHLPATAVIGETTLSAEVSQAPSESAPEITVSAGDLAAAVVRVEPSGTLAQSPFVDADGIEPDNAEELSAFTSRWLDVITTEA